MSSHEATELKLYIENDGDLHRQQGSSILKNLATKKAKGTYDHALAVKLYGYLVESGAKKYSKEFGGVWHQSFDVPTRKEVATDLTNDFESEWSAGNYRDLLPKKYQAEAKPKATKAKGKKKSAACIARECDEILARIK